LTKEEKEKYELNLIAFFKFFFTKCNNILKVSNQYIDIGVEYAFDCINRETSNQTADEAKAILEGLESMTFEIEDFRYVYDLFLKKYTIHENWRVRNQAIFTVGMIATKMCLDVNYQNILNDVYIFIYDPELKIRRMAVILFENIFNILPNYIW